MPGDACVKAWLEKVERIPSEALPFIVQKITDDADRMPTNLPKLFRELFQRWQNEMATPQQMRQVASGCPDCEGGILWLVHSLSGKTATVFCACYAGEAGMVGKASLGMMRARGWERLREPRRRLPQGQIASC